MHTLRTLLAPFATAATLAAFAASFAGCATAPPAPTAAPTRQEIERRRAEAEALRLMAECRDGAWCRAIDGKVAILVEDEEADNRHLVYRQPAAK